MGLLGKVTVGMSAMVKPEEPIKGEFPAKVTVVDKVVDAASGTFGVRLELPNPDFSYRPGSNAPCGSRNCRPRMRSFSMRITTGLILVVLAVLPARADTVPEVNCVA